MSQAAIDTLTLSWSAIRDEFRARLRGLHGNPWWEHARLLRVMGFGHGFGWNIQQTYNQRRGSNLLLSPLDWLLLEHYAFYGIPRCGIERGIHAMFDRRDRAPEIQHINSLAYCNQAILKESELIKEASVGGYSHDYGCGHCAPMGETHSFPCDCACHVYVPARARPHTLLLAVPPAGRMTFAAMQSERQVDRVAELFQVGIVFTVYPDPWHKSEARTRFGVELEFLDKEFDPVTLLPGSRLAGRLHGTSPRSRSRQPFLNGGAV